jgi:hypothetical protein
VTAVTLLAASAQPNQVLLVSRRFARLGVDMARSLSYTAPMPATQTTDWYSRAMEKLVTIVQQLSLARDFDSVTGIVRQAARELTDADGATFILRDGDFCSYVDEDAIAPLWKGRRFPMSECISGWVMLNRRPAIAEDIYADPRILHATYRPTFVKSLSMVPIRTLDPIGAIGIYWAQSRIPLPEEVKVLQALADTTAVALDNVRIYAELEQRVKQRTAALEAANSDLDSFSHSVSHDLRAPVRAISGFCSLIRKDHASELSAEGQRKLDVIKTEADRLGRLIDGLLAFSRLGRQPLKPVDLDMTELAEGVFAKLRDLNPGSNVVFRLSRLPRAAVDRSLFEQVWANLLSNAIKYSSKTDVPIIEAQGRSEAQETVYSVRDNGVGFDPRYATRLFKTFQRLHHEADFPGNGVGLALVHRIVTKHGGRVWAEGEPDNGATFYFALPVDRHSQSPLR